MRRPGGTVLRAAAHRADARNPHIGHAGRDAAERGARWQSDGRTPMRSRRPVLRKGLYGRACMEGAMGGIRPAQPGAGGTPVSDPAARGPATKDPATKVPIPRRPAPRSVHAPPTGPLVASAVGHPTAARMAIVHPIHMSLWRCTSGLCTAATVPRLLVTVTRWRPEPCLPCRPDLHVRPWNPMNHTASGVRARDVRPP